MTIVKNPETPHCLDHTYFYHKCKACRKLYHADHYKKNKDAYKKNHAEWYKKNSTSHKEKTLGSFRKRRYGISKEDFADLLSQQRNKCSICSESFIDGNDSCLDHCHDTGKIRGILCRKCNMALGLFKDNWNILSRAMDYLERFE